MKSKLYFLVAAILAAATPVTAAAQTAAAPDAATMAAANRLLDSIDYDVLTQRTLDAVIAEGQRGLPQRIEAASGRTLPEELKKKLSDLIAQSVRRTYQNSKAELRRGTALVYARHFTVAELTRLAELQRDPVMRKMQLAMPQIAAETMALTQAALAKEQPQMQADVRRLLEEYMSESKG